MATQIPQAGTRMSLISKADIRYEGVLSHIDMAKSEICLTQVQSFGTEQRPAAEFVAASADKFDCIIFKGADIKDLNVLDQQAPEGYLSSAPAQAPPPAPPPAQQQPGAPGAPSPWGPPQQQPSGEAQWGPPQPPGASSGGPSQPYYAQGQGHPSQSAAPAPGYGGPKPQPPQAPPHAGTGRPQPAPAPTVVITPARVPPPPQHAPSAPSAPSAPPPGLQQQQPQANGPPAAQLPNGAPARPAPQEGSSQAPVRPRPPPSYANAAGGGRRGRGRGPPPPGGRGPPPPGGRGPAPQGRGPSGRGPGRGHAEPQAPRAPPVPVPAEDFDFEEGIQKFNKEEVKPEVEKESTPSENVYEKDDFFDKLSCEALERLNVGAGGGGQPGQPGKLPPRTRFAEQRKLDIETFGGTGIARRNNFGRGHGRRGGRGGPRGRGRGRAPQAAPVPAS